MLFVKRREAWKELDPGCLERRLLDDLPGQSPQRQEAVIQEVMVKFELLIEYERSKRGHLL